MLANKPNAAMMRDVRDGKDMRGKFAQSGEELAGAL
jgi:hypothetical protein